MNITRDQEERLRSMFHYGMFVDPKKGTLEADLRFAAFAGMVNREINDILDGRQTKWRKL